MIHLHLRILYNQYNNFNNLHYIFQKLLKINLNIQEQNKTKFIPKKSVLQRSLIEGLPTPIFEYIGRMKTIEPRPDYVVGVDMTSNSKQQFKKEFG